MEEKISPIKTFFALLKNWEEWKFVPLEDEGYSDIFYCEADSRYRLELIAQHNDIPTKVPFYAYVVSHADKDIYYCNAYLEENDLKLEQPIEIVLLDETKFMLPIPELSYKHLSQSKATRYAYYVENTQSWELLSFLNHMDVWGRQSDFEFNFARFVPIFKNKKEKEEFDEWVNQKEHREEIMNRLGKAKETILPLLPTPEIESADENDKEAIYLSKVLNELLEEFRDSAR